MILRKPYAFLIKHFRLIHIIILAAVSYILYKTITFRSFLDEYIGNNQRLKTIDDLTEKYVGIPFILIVLFVIILSGIILYLLKHKNKPYKFYIIAIVSNALLFLLLLYSRSFVYDLNFSTPDLRFTRIIRDVYTIEMFAQILFDIFVFVRAVGFDIRKFDFKRDMVEFNVSEEDNAEFEFQVELDKDDVNAKVKKFRRYFKYYYKENKVVFLVFGLIVLTVSTFFIVRFFTSKEKIYKEREVFNTSMLSISVLDSYKTTVNYRKEELNKDKYYVILKLRYKNNSNTDLQIITDNARISYDDYNSVVPTDKYDEEFSEYGVRYFAQILHSGEIKDYVFVYELDRENIDNDLLLKYLYDIRYVNKEVKYYYRTVKLEPKELSKDITFVDKKELGETLTFKDSLLGDTSITISNISFGDRFSYNTLNCFNLNCSSSRSYLQSSTFSDYALTLMRVDYDIDYDDSMSTYKINKFFEKYGNIRFVYKDKEYNHKIALKDVSPYLSNNYAFLEVRDKVSVSDKIYLDITIGDKMYTYLLKGTDKKEEVVEDNIEQPLEENTEVVVEQ